MKERDYSMLSDSFCRISREKEDKELENNEYIKQLEAKAKTQANLIDKFN